MTSVSEEMVVDLWKIYSKMSVLELLAEENIMTKFWYHVRLDPARMKLRKILRYEIEKKLR